MEIKLDFSVIKCDQEHINPATAKKCSVCGEIFDDIEEKELLHQIRKDKLAEVFDIVKEKEKYIKILNKKIREKTISLEEHDNEFGFACHQIELISSNLSSGIFNELDLTSEIIGSSEFSITLLQLKSFFTNLYEPIINVMKCKSNDNMHKNSINRILKIAYATKDIFVIFLNSTIQDSLDKAKDYEIKGQEMLDEATKENRILSRLFSSSFIDSTVDLFSNGGMNYSAFSAMTLYNQNESSVEETILQMSQDSFFYYRRYLTKKYADYSMEDFLLLTMYMNNSLMLFDENEYFKKLNVANNMLEKAYLTSPFQFTNYINQYKERYIFMMKKMYELHFSASFIFANNPDEKIIIINVIKWYKDLCEGVYRDSSIMLYICCALLKNSSYDSDLITKKIGFADITCRFGSLNNKYNLNRLTDGVHNIIRHAEAHVDYDINYLDESILFRNKQKGLSEKISFNDFMLIFMQLQETINAITNAFEIFLLNHDEFLPLAKEIHLELVEDIPISQVDMAPLLRGIITTNQEVKIIEDECFLEIEGICIKEEGLGSCENLLSIFYTIVKCDNQYDNISLKVDDTEGNLICEVKLTTKYLRELDLEQDNSIYMLGFIKYLFNSKLPHFTDKKSLLNDMYYNIIRNLLENISKMTKLREGLIFGDDLSISLISYSKKLNDEIEYILYILRENENIVKDTRINTHLIEIVDRMKTKFMELSNHKKADNKFDAINKAISTDMFNLIDLIKLFKGEIDEEFFCRTKTSAGINMFKNIGRNAPCPCGSGKKYKKLLRYNT
jgi:hypothetical protein